MPESHRPAHPRCGSGRFSTYVLSHERETGKLIPRRGTIHDMGRSVSHKAIICSKSLVERKPTSQVAQDVTEQKIIAGFDQEDGANQGGRMMSGAVGAYSSTARHAANCAESG